MQSVLDRLLEDRNGDLDVSRLALVALAELSGDSFPALIAGNSPRTLQLLEVEAMAGSSCTIDPTLALLVFQKAATATYERWGVRALAPAFGAAIRHRFGGLQWFGHFYSKGRLPN